MILRLFKTIAAVLVTIFCIVLGYQLIMAKSAKEKYDPDNPPIIKIADKRFQLPVDFSNFKYGITHGGYEQLEFVLDINTFKPITADYKKDNNLTLELRPLGSEWGEKNYWTEKDPAFLLEPFRCQSFNVKGVAYEDCALLGKGQINSYANTEKHAVRRKDTNQYIFMYGCTEKNPHLNRICTARSKILDTLQVEYHYRFINFPRAIEIDFAIRDMIESMYQPVAQEKKP